MTRSGTGRKRDPFRYWLPGREATFLKDLPELDELPLGDRRAYLRLAEAVLRRPAEDE